SASDARCSVWYGEPPDRAVESRRCPADGLVDPDIARGRTDDAEEDVVVRCILPFAEHAALRCRRAIRRRDCTILLRGQGAARIAYGFLCGPRTARDGGWRYVPDVRPAVPQHEHSARRIEIHSVQLIERQRAG